ncbi:MAG TPA: nucleotide sugar dehydrogenase [Nitrospira sp.]|nr:nucleotide sugar dehydrogenase [Nitrospira sp.]
MSVSLLSGRAYEIPAVLDDVVRIENFLSAHSGKRIVVVQGLGFVGAVMALVCANALTEEYAVIGVDLPGPSSYWRIRSINDGVFPVVAADKKVEEFHQKALAKGNLFATYDPYAYSKADVVIVDVNLDVQKDTTALGDLHKYDVDLTNFRKAITAIGEHCREDVLILVETTVPPGTCQLVVRPIIVECLTRRGLRVDRFRLGHSYERVMPGPDYVDSIQNFYRVYSGVDEASAQATEGFLKTVVSTDQYPLTRLGSTNATEMAKVLENSFRAINIAFMVEWSRFAEEAGVNLYEVVNAIRMRPTHRNMMLPGIGVGGYCLTKDPLLASWARQYLIRGEGRLEESEKGVRINDKMPVYAYEFLKKSVAHGSLKGKRVLLLGVSYRSDVGDTRYSPVERFFQQLVAEGCEVLLHDYYVSLWEETGRRVAADYVDFFANPLDIIAITTAHSGYRGSDRLQELILEQKPLLILDTVGLLSEVEIALLSRRHRVRVVGRGDLT